MSREQRLVTKEHIATHTNFILQVKILYCSTLFLNIVLCVGGSKQKECSIYQEVASLLYEK